MQKNQLITFIVFSLAIVVGAFGLALTLSPYEGLAGNYTLVFAVEAIRLGLVIVTVQVRKLNPEQYKYIMGGVVLLTLINAFTIDSHCVTLSEDWYSSQCINLAIIIGEYAMAVMIAGPVKDVVVNAELSKRLREALEELSEVKEGISESKTELSDSKQVLSTTQQELSESLEKVSRLQDRETNLLATNARLSAQLKESLDVSKNWLAMSSQRVSVNSVKQAVCKCGRITLNTTNRQLEKQCECGKELSYE